VAVGHSVEVAGWVAESDKLLDRMAGRFAEPGRRSGRWSGDHRSAGGCSECM